MEKVREAHSLRHPELSEVARVFATFRTDMEAHAQKEEQVLFPCIAKLDADEPFSLTCGSVRYSIQEMEKEHEDAGAALATLRRLTDGYTFSEEVCSTYRAMLDALAELEDDTHRHVHKENSILFPRAESRVAILTAQQAARESGYSSTELAGRSRA